MVDIQRLRDLFPEINPREEKSNFQRFLDAFQQEVDSNAIDLDEIRESHYIDTASGDELDEIGAMFGPVGRRDGRTDAEYKAFLKSIVRSFKSRGTKEQIASAIRAALGIDEDDPNETSTVSISEDTETLTYRVEVTNWPEHDTATINAVADRADPSGVTFDTVIYTSEGSYIIAASTSSATVRADGLGTFTLGDGTLLG